MELIHAFIDGMREFRSAYTTHYNNLDLLDAYDRGREFMHILTFRRFEQ